MILTFKLVPFWREVLPDVDALNFGLNGRVAQFAASNGLDTPALTPAVEAIVPATLIGEQFVGLNMNPGRSMVTLTVLICKGIPSRIRGNGSDVTVICAVCGSTLIAARTITFPRLNGPATAGTT